MCIPACLDKITTHGLISKMCTFVKEGTLSIDFFPVLDRLHHENVLEKDWCHLLSCVYYLALL